jgi:hypothetical protein
MSPQAAAKLDSFNAVEHALGGYRDHLRLVDGLGQRVELRRRMARLSREEVVVLVRWYLERVRPEVIAHDLARSVCHVCRSRTAAIERLAALGHGDDLADADSSEFV